MVTLYQYQYNKIEYVFSTSLDKVHDAVVCDLVAELCHGEGVGDGAPPEARRRVGRRVHVRLQLQRAERPRT